MTLVRRIATGFLLTGLLAPGALPAYAGEQQIVAAMRAFLDSADLEARRRLVEQILSDPAYERSRVGPWL
ncbi:MAG: hypothetical protein JSV80_06450, partial [Acidobacteriota bacterium]